MKVLVVGQGGREHALSWKLAQSPLVEQVFIAPGNAGTAAEEKCTNIAIEACAIEQLAEFASSENIALTVVGPEAPLVAGIADYFQGRGLLCFAPSKAAAQLEGSKTFSKEFLQRNNIPTARYRSCETSSAAIEALKDFSFPVVIKADGLAAGKGVVIAKSHDEAVHTLQAMLDHGQYGTAGAKVVIEEFLQGKEASFIVMVDGEDIVPMATSQDYKTRFDGNTGPNTGGMGAFSPATRVNEALHQRIMSKIIRPTVAALKTEALTYRGFLYAGLMIDDAGNAKVLEFNCRLGDPETQPILMRLQADLAQLCLAGCQGKLLSVPIAWSEKSALGVVMVAAGYPGNYRKGEQIASLPQDSNECKIFHAGTTTGTGATVITCGGRVLCATAVADTLDDARHSAYALAKKISWAGASFRQDIGQL